MTNEEWIKSLPTEEFVEYIDFQCLYLKESKECINTSCKTCTLEWLKQEHKEDE